MESASDLFERVGARNVEHLMSVEQQDTVSGLAADSKEDGEVFLLSLNKGVIDSGIDYNHVDLKANMWKNPGEIPGNKKMIKELHSLISEITE